MATAAALAGGSLVSGLFGANAAKKAAQSQTDAAKYASDIQMQMFNRGLEMNEPFRQAGIGGLQSLIDLGRQEDKPFSFDYGAYFNSPEYAALSSQQQAQTLANVGATGGLRSGNSQAALATIAPQLAQQGRQNAMSEYSLNQAALMDRYNRLQGIVGLGLGVSQQGASQAGQVGSALANNALYAGNANANKYNQYGQLAQGVLGNAGSLYAFNKMGGFGGNGGGFSGAGGGAGGIGRIVGRGF